MLNTAFVFLLTTLLDILTAMFLLRFYLQWVQAPYRNPISSFVIALTDFAIKPSRRFVPSWRRLDLSTLLAALMTQAALYFALFYTNNFGGNIDLSALLLMILVALLKIFLYIVMYAVFLQALLSWIAPYNPLYSPLNAMTQPLYALFGRWTPKINGIDLSPFVLLIFVQLLIVLLGSI